MATLSIDDVVFIDPPHIIEDSITGNKHAAHRRIHFGRGLTGDSDIIFQDFLPEGSLKPEETKYVTASLPDHLLLDSDDLHVLISTKSGNGKAEMFFDDHLELLLRWILPSGSRYQSLRTQSPASIRDFVDARLKLRADEGVPQTLLVLAGDGAVVDLINGLMQTPRSSQYVPPVIVLFPFGTGNALFHSIHQQVATNRVGDLTLALRDLLSVTHKPLPIFSARFSEGAKILSDEGRIESSIPGNCLFGAVVTSYGFHSQLVADSDTAEYRKHGDKRFQMVAKDLLADFHAYNATVSVQYGGETSMTNIRSEGQDENKHAYIVATLVSNFEKTFTISPHSKPLDGHLRIIEIGPIPAEDVLEIMTDAYSGGKHIETRSTVGYRRIDKLRIEFREDDARWRKVCIDGLIVVMEKDGWLEVQRVPESPLSIIWPFMGTP